MALEAENFNEKKILPTRQSRERERKRKKVIKKNGMSFNALQFILNYGYGIHKMLQFRSEMRKEINLN